MAASAAGALTRVVIQSSHLLLRDALAGYLAVQGEFAVLGRVSDPSELFALCEMHPDVALLDAGDQMGEVVEVSRALRTRLPSLRVVILRHPGGPPEADETGITMASFEGMDRLCAVLLGRAGAPVRSGVEGARLTDRQVEVVTLMSTGRTVAEIAMMLGISPSTVENHKRRIYSRLAAHSGAQAVSRAAQLGFIGGSDGLAPSWPQLSARQSIPSRPPQPEPLLSRPPALLGAAERPVPPQPAAPGGEDAGRAPLTWLSGRPGPLRDQVARLLVAHGMSVVLDGGRVPAPDDEWLRMHRGPMTWVLIDPLKADRERADMFGAPVVLICDEHQDAPRTDDQAEAWTGTQTIDQIGTRDDGHGGDLTEAWADDRGGTESGGQVSDQSLRAGARLTAGQVCDDLIPVLDLVAKGYIVASREETQARSGRAPGIRPPLDARVLPKLSLREAEILYSIARGHTLRQTARDLHIAVKTVENIQSRLFRKLGVRNRAGALATSYSMGLLRADWPP